MHTDDFTIFSLDMSFAMHIPSYMPSSPLGVYKPLVSCRNEYAISSLWHKFKYNNNYFDVRNCSVMRMF